MKTNDAQFAEIQKCYDGIEMIPIWVRGDAYVVLKELPVNNYDMVFTCPPYYDLEVYSDKPNDLSNMSFDDFKSAYSNILKKCFKKLKNNRYTVVSENEEIKADKLIIAAGSYSYYRDKTSIYDILKKLLKK